MLHFFFGFDGRIRRTNYFFGALITLLVAGAFGMHWMHAWGWGYGWSRWDYDFVPWPMAPGFWLIGSVVGVACFWAQMALASKRWHDAGASGWLALLSLIPGVHVIIFLVLCLIPPTHGANAYGRDPRAGAPAAA